MKHLFSIVLTACCLFGCTAEAQVAPPSAVAPPEPTSFSLGSGDKLRITVFGEQKLSGDYAVTNTGYISFPLIGNVQVSGRTLEEVQESMRAALAGGYLQDPRVSIEIVNYRPFYILGEVEKPGQYPYVAGLTLEQAIATAGGYTYRAKHDQVLIKGASESSEQSMKYKDRKILVQPGDTIRIPERFF